ncbi:hypothetical protein MBLNU457_4143t1 [Dothideomycetes sp. NU457]
MLRLSLTRRISLITDRTRAICICDSESLCQQSRRYARRATAKKAPETRRHQRESDIRFIPADEIERRQQTDEWIRTTGRDKWSEHADKIYANSREAMNHLCKAAALEERPDPLNLQKLHKSLICIHERYLAEFPEGAERTAYDFKWYYENKYQQIRLAFESVPLEKLYQAGRHLISSKFGEYQRSATGLLLCCAREGHDDATIFMLHTFLRQAKAGRRSPLNSAEAVALERRLAAIADRGNFRAKALRGHLELFHHGLTRDAMKHFHGALPGAVEFSQQKISRATTPFLAIQRQDELSSPWLELAMAAWKFGDRGLLGQADKAGTVVDDPDMLRQKALRERTEKHAPYTNDWLHNMTRAAASGNVDASWEMANYYANAPAPPPPSDSDLLTSPFKLALQLWRAFDPMPSSANTQQNMEYYASLLQSPQERMQMAIYWLRVGTSYGYVPSLVSLAHLHVCKYILPVNNLDFDNFGHPDEQIKDAHKRRVEEYGIDFTKMEDGVDNPHYSPRLAHDCLLLAMAMIGRVKIASDPDPENNNPYVFRLGKLGTFPEVVADYEEDLGKLERDALYIADMCGIDIQDSYGGVAYMHKGKRGSGVFEFGKVEVVKEFRKELMPARPEIIGGNWVDLKAAPHVAETAGEK